MRMDQLPGSDSSSRQVGSRRDSSRCGGSHSISTRITSSFDGRHSKTDMPFLFSRSLRNVYVATFFKLLGWAAGQCHTPCVHPTNQTGVIAW